LQLGAEVTGALTNNFQLSRGQLQTQFGGNYELGKNFTLDFGVIAGRFAASPRVGLLIGTSIDFNRPKIKIGKTSRRRLDRAEVSAETVRAEPFLQS